jgi:hypothetical protein
MSRVDRAHVERLLEDASLTYREVARRAGCSDWSVRAIERELAGDSRPMKRAGHERDDGGEESLGFAGWAALTGFVAVLGFAVWLAMRGNQPPDM